MHSLKASAKGAQVTDLHVRDWILEVLDIEVDEKAKDGLMQLLRGGDLLVNLVNKFICESDSGKKLRISTSEMPIVRVYENVNNFLEVCQIYFGLPAVVLFSYNDFKAQNVKNITKTLLSLHNAIVRRDGPNVPQIRIDNHRGSLLKRSAKLVITAAKIGADDLPCPSSSFDEEADALDDPLDDDGKDDFFSTPKRSFSDEPHVDYENEIKEQKSKFDQEIEECKKNWNEERSAMLLRCNNLEEELKEFEGIKKQLNETNLKILALQQKNKLMSTEITTWQTECTKWQDEFTKIQQELATRKLEHEVKVKTLNDANINTWRILRKPMDTLRQEFLSLKQKVQDRLKDMQTVFQETTDVLVNRWTESEAQHEQRHEEMTTEISNLHSHCAKLQKEQKKLLNQVIEAKGNIRVFTRIRPLKSSEQKGGSAVRILSDRECILNGNLFKFDNVFGPTASQGDLFTETKPFVQACVEGYNVCMFAYGQTGSGKTYTMEGVKGNRGMNYLCTEKLFEMMHERSNVMNYRVKVSIVEIYVGHVLDLLLSPKEYNTQQNLKIKQGHEGVYIPGLTEVEVFSAEEIIDLLNKRAAVNRRTNATSMNQSSSRSHCVLMVSVDGAHVKERIKTKGKMIMVDLAGSERVNRSQVTGAGFKEATEINKSLSALGNVIHSLQHKKSHTPYRDSKLTYLLQNVLGGHSKCLMFCQISPALEDAPESLCTLKFASRVASVQLGEAKKNQKVSGNSHEVEKYKTLVRKLREDLESQKRRKSQSEAVTSKIEVEKQELETKVSQMGNQLKSKDRELAGLKESFVKAEQRFRLQTKKFQSQSLTRHNRINDSQQLKQQVKEVEAKSMKLRKEMEKKLENAMKEINELKKQVDIKTKKYEHLKIQASRNARRTASSKGSSTLAACVLMPPPAPVSVADSVSNASIPAIDESSLPPETPSRPVLQSLKLSTTKSAMRSLTKQRREWSGQLFSRTTPGASRMRARIQKKVTSSSDTEDLENTKNISNHMASTTNTAMKKRVRFTSTSVEGRGTKSSAISRRIKARKGSVLSQGAKRTVVRKKLGWNRY